MTHTKSPHFKVLEDFVEEYDDPFTRPPVVEFFKTIYIGRGRRGDDITLD